MSNYNYEDISNSKEDLSVPTDVQVLKGAEEAVKPSRSVGGVRFTLRYGWQKLLWTQPRPGDSKPQPNILFWQKGPSKMPPSSLNATITPDAIGSGDISQDNAIAEVDQHGDVFPDTTSKRLSSNASDAGSDISSLSLFWPLSRRPNLAEPLPEAKSRDSEFTKHSNAVDEFFAERVGRWSWSE